MNVTFLGVRGSTLALGPEFARYGGHTSCVAIGHAGQAPSLLLDAGTGLRSLPRLMGDAPFRGALLLTHLHWDHLQGLPFCSSLDCADADVRLYLPEQDGTAREVLSRMMSPPFFPIAPDGLKGAWSFRSLEESTVELDGFEVTALRGPPPRGPDVRLPGLRRIVARSPTSPTTSRPRPAGARRAGATTTIRVLDLVAGVDLLVHDAQFASSELPAFHHWGHSSADYAVGLGRRGGARARRAVPPRPRPQRCRGRPPGRGGAPSRHRGLRCGAGRHRPTAGAGRRHLAAEDLLSRSPTSRRGSGGRAVGAVAGGATRP